MFQQLLHKQMAHMPTWRNSSHLNVSCAPHLLKCMMIFIFLLWTSSPGYITISFAAVVFNYKYLELKYVNEFYRK